MKEVWEPHLIKIFAILNVEKVTAPAIISELLFLNCS